MYNPNNREVKINPSTGRPYLVRRVPTHELICQQTGQPLKQCQTCKERKPSQLCFGPDRRTVDGVSWHCKDCTEKINAIKEEKRKKRQKEYSAKYSKTARFAQNQILRWEKQVKIRSEQPWWQEGVEPKEYRKQYAARSPVYAEAQVRYWSNVWEKRYLAENRKQR